MIFMLQIKKYESLIKAAPIIVFDANLTVDAMSTILELCKKYNKPGMNTNTIFIRIFINF